jgi:hypothetical protein
MYGPETSLTGGIPGGRDAPGSCPSFGSVPAALYLLMVPQAIRSPASPAGWLL